MTRPDELSELRVSDADRNGTLRRLHNAVALGLIDITEFEERSSHVSYARTRNELDRRAGGRHRTRHAVRLGRDSIARWRERVDRRRRGLRRQRQRPAEGRTGRRHAARGVDRPGGVRRGQNHRTSPPARAPPRPCLTPPDTDTLTPCLFVLHCPPAWS